MRKQINIALAAITLMATGCATVQQGNDPVVVNAERAIQTASDTFNTLFTVEANNHALLKENAPAVVKGVNELRVQGPKALDAVIELTKTYKYNRNEQNKANLSTALAVLANAISQAQRYLTKIGT